MALDLWTHQFCLACDKQVHSDGAAYCSESCRLADHETTTTTTTTTTPPCSQASSPGPAAPCHELTTMRPSSHRLCLPPPLDFNRGQLSKLSLYLGQPSIPLTSIPNLSPSSSHSSLCSMQSTASSVDASHLSDKSRQELKAYAISFEQVRLQRRRSH
ncbi:hypothetical protein L249_2321 [Ophiocordyceps polyrhachis-furcata BCC 54312]|uniref:Life-span regulatory factor domain-containing protein n=1 Tax=Ophiocordyceps polyrhachis-furcata BCC 54312 TaxID=1330021 RepID=A0A367LRM6_9HYPO|nr:hypothetical protein L249_2321 [Ophiocordyceps polyrhachis-furcata BCC 54312]